MAAYKAEHYLNDIKNLLGCVDASALDSAVSCLIRAVTERKTLFTAGNGGSASTANHFAADFGKNVTGADGIRPRVIPLSAAIAAITAYANDDGYENAFASQLECLVTERDVLLVISASGNSPSVVKAAELAKAHRATVIAMTGFEGGALAGLADIHLHAPDRRYETVEDAHMVFCHLLVCCVRAHIAGGTQ